MNKYKYRRRKNALGCSARCLNSFNEHFQIYTAPEDKLKSLGFSAHIVATLDCSEDEVKMIVSALNKAS